MPRTLAVAFKIAYRSITRRKFRSALTTLGVVIGISTIVSLMTVAYGMRTQVKNTLNEMLGAGIIISSRTGGVDIPEYVKDIILNVSGVKDAVPVVTTMINVGDRPVLTIGINPEDATRLYRVSLEEGRLLRQGEKDSVIFGATTAATLGIGVNDTVTLSAQQGVVGKKFRVVGLLRAIGTGELNIGCFLTLDAAQELVNRKGYVSNILVVLEDPNLGESLEETFREMFEDANIVRQEEIMRQIDRVMSVINGVLLALGSVSLAVGALGILNTVMMSVHERRREIGMLKAVGAERWHVLFLFLSEALIISIIGGVIGCGLGLAGVYLIQWLVSIMGLNLTVPLLVAPEVLIGAFLMAITIGLFAGLYPSWKAANVPPVEALRYE
jgi:putative ABC transport system permease protein